MNPGHGPPSSNDPPGKPDDSGPTSIEPRSVPNPASSQLISEIKVYIARHNSALLTLIDDDDPTSGGELLGRRHARAADGLLRSLFAAACTQVLGADAPKPKVALAAVGSYGRGAVALKSDLDVRILVSGARDDAAAIAEAMLYPLWDGGLSIGHQVVTIDEIIELARDDLPTATSLLDWRHLCGDERLSAALSVRARKALFDGASVASFAARLVEEVKGRHERYGGSVYLLEPDVKNGAGGLRDLDVTLWLCRARWGASSLEDLAERDVLLGREIEQISSARELLWRVRNRLHLAAHRRADRLTFDQQERLAVQLGYLPASSRRDDEGACAAAVESFMSDYYRNARSIAHVRELLANRARPVPRVRKEQALGGGLRLADGLLTMTEQADLSADPALALRVVAEAVQRRVAVDPFARESIARSAQEPVFCERLRTSPEAARLFVSLCMAASDTGFLGRSVLEELHDLGLLVAMIPEFSPVVGRVHHDVYHVYTVDVHSVAAVDRLRALVRGDLADEHPLACRLAAEMSQPEVLFLATLLHDVGKAIGGKDHAGRGAQMSLEIGARLGLTAGQIDQIAHLVRTHLDMYHVATKRDLDDPRELEGFVNTLRGRENLRELYLLTVADLSTTSPTAMTAWKAKLLDELYLGAEALLAGQVGHGLDAARVEQATLDVLRAAGETKAAEEFLASMTDRYVLSNSPEAIAEHMLVSSRAGSEGLALSLRPSPHAGLAELCVAASDRPGLLASITAAITSCRLEVQAAQIHSHALADGTIQALDLFWVKGALGEARALGQAEKLLDRELRAFISGERLVASALSAKGSSPWASRHTPSVQTSISVDDRASPTHGILEVVTRNRPGVLCALALALHELRLSISLAKINTEGTRVADVFYVTDERGQKVELLPWADEIRQKIVAALALSNPRQGSQRS